MQRGWSLKCAASIWLIVIARCPRVMAQEPIINRMAQELSQELEKNKKKDFSPKVLVIDFTSQPGGIRALGDYLADQFSNALAQMTGRGVVIDRKVFHHYLQTDGISPFDLADRDIALWTASEVGANAIVFGSVKPSEDKLILSVELIRIGDGKHLGFSTSDLFINNQLMELIPKPFDWPASPGVAVACLSSASSDVITATFKAAGVTEPVCIHCPTPEYTDETRRAKAQGVVKFDVVVDTEGRAKRIATVKGDKYDFAAQAMGAIKSWKFRPATKDGKPVTVCVLIEVTFRLY